MYSLKKSIFWAAFYMAVIILLAQFDYFEDTPFIDFAKYFYIVAILVIPATMFFPSVLKLNVYIPLIIWGCIYLVILQTLDRTSSSPNGSFAIVLLEFILVEAGAWLGYQMTHGISHAESMMDAMAITAFPHRTQHIEEASKQIKTEFTRCRRFHRPLSILVLQLHTDDHVSIKEMVATIQRDLWNRFSYARIGQVIDEHIRQTDMVFRDRASRFVLLCPETDLNSTQMLASRISDVITNRTGILVNTGLAVFPEDAINFDDLLDVAVSRLKHPETNMESIQKIESVEVRS